MSISDIITKMPRFYLLAIILFSLYYAIRGIMEKKILNADKNLSCFQKIMIEYIQEFLFKVTFTISGFVALLIANYILSSLQSFNQISTGTAVFLIFLFIWGTLGVSGYLTFLIIRGKFPLVK